MPPKTFPGEFEQMVMLAVLQCRERAFALEVRRTIEESAGRTVSRGAFYTTLDRLEQKGLVRWSEDAPADARAVAPLRRYTVTEEGLAALRNSRAALLNLWNGLDSLLEPA
jgi:DNA-binding PadR family transcriptional regulator